MVKSTIRISGLNQRASIDTQSLFASLEAFVNLGDSLKEFQSFVNAHPTFWPTEFRTTNGDLFGWGKDTDLHAVTLICRNYLRELWRGNGNVDDQSERLKLLLGFIPYAQEVPMLGLVPQGPSESLRLAQEMSLVKTVHNLQHFSPSLGADWVRGEFRHAPLNDFQRAVYALWRESWRARTCPECARLFIAGKPPQLYCSVRCSVAARRKRDLDLWYAKGDERRRTRREESQHKKRQRAHRT